MNNRRRVAGINSKTIRSLKEIFFFVMLLSSSVLCITAVVYFQSQFELSQTMVLCKEIAEDYFPSAICDKEGKIHIVWQSDKKGNWDIYYTCLGDQVHREEFISLTSDSSDEMSPWITEDEKGNIWAIWVSRDSDGNSICGKVLETQSSWSDEKEFISRNDNCEKKSPSLISLGSDKMLFAWISRKERDQEIRYAINNDSEEQSKLLAITNNARRVVLGKTKTGKVFALWDSMTEGESYLYFSLFDEEDNFTKHELLTSPAGEPFVGDSPFVISRKGKPSILFFRTETYNILSSIELEENVSGFPVFSQPTPFCETGYLEDWPAAIETNEGEIYLFWSSDYTRDNEIFFYHSPNSYDFIEKKIQYEGDTETMDEDGDVKRFARNLTLDPNAYNANLQGYSLIDIFSSVAVIGDELWVVWDSYHWDFAEKAFLRDIKYVKTSDGHYWSEPVTVVDISKSRKRWGDDRCPAITATEDGRIWLFWHSDRYRTETVNNFEICYIMSEDGGNSWNWRIQDEDPFLLTNDPGRDMHPSVSSIGDRIFVVWQSDGRSNNFDIFFGEFDGKRLLSAQCIANQDVPEYHPSIAAYREWCLASMGYEENITVAWESKMEGCYACYFSTVNPSNIFLVEKQQNTDICYPSMCYVSRHNMLSNIWPKDLWFVWQYNEIWSKKSNILCRSRQNEKPITDDFSHNEKPEIIEFDDKIWIFWDSDGGGDEKGIFYKYMYRKNIPLWLSIYSYVLAVCWVLFFLDIRSKGGVRNLMLELSKWIDELFSRHIGLRDVIIGVAASLLTYIFLQIFGMFFGYFFG